MTSKDMHVKVKSLNYEISGSLNNFDQILSVKYITKTCLFKYTTKNEIFQIKKSDIFYISAENIDCRYSLEPPLRGGSNEYLQSMFSAEIRQIMYTPVNPSL